MDRAIEKVVILGGGTAGWLSACFLMASRNPTCDRPLQVTLIESPDMPTIGVGEGTWPTMRRTLQHIGIDEKSFLLACDASFKQGSRFDGWHSGSVDDRYYHPFVPPAPNFGSEFNLANPLFAEAVSPQPAICALDLAPRQRAMPGYAGALNYAYHFDAGKFAALLTSHATERLGVRHIRDHVTLIQRDGNGDCQSLGTRGNGLVEGDLFLDCSGHSSLLIGGELQVPLVDRSTYLFNDRALATQVPVAPGSAIASQTIGTAHEAGWIWDIGLPSRRGIGCVYSSGHMDDESAAATLRSYLRQAGLDEQTPARKLSFQSANRERPWERNCIAIGQSAGFVEPLEASAIVMIELSLQALVENFPATKASMALHAKRFNRLSNYRWDRIVDFLKLHYVMSSRDEPYWREHRDPASIPASLQELLELWSSRSPHESDLPMVDEVFPVASYQYVLFGMGFRPPAAGALRSSVHSEAAGLRQVEERARALAASLPTNRAYLDALRSSCEPKPEMTLGLS